MKNKFMAFTVACGFGLVMFGGCFADSEDLTLTLVLVGTGIAVLASALIAGAGHMED